MFKRTALIGSLVLALQMLCIGGSAWAKAPTSTTVVEVLSVGSIQLDNPTAFPFALKLDERSIGTLLPGARILMKNTPAGVHTLTARSIGKRNIPNQTLSATVRANRRTRLQLGEVMGALTIMNPNPMPLMLRINGTNRGMIQPGETERFSQVRPGRKVIELRGKKNIKTSGVARVRAGQVTQFTAPTILGSMRIRNQTGRRIHVLIDGKRSGTIANGGTRRFTSLALGSHAVEIRGPGGLNITRTFTARADGKGTMTIARNTERRFQKYGQKPKGQQLLSVKFSI
jgi:hypothetical protein